MCVELLVNLCHHPSKGLAAASASGGSRAEGATGSPLGDVPHQIRGFLSDWSNMILSAQAFSSWYIGPALFMCAHDANLPSRAAFGSAVLRARAS